MESLDYTFVISAVVLGLSLLATAAKFFDWFIHSDPATMVRTSRWIVLLLLAASVAALLVMIARGQWSAAMLAGAASLLMASVLKWRATFSTLRMALRKFRPKRILFDMEIADDDIRDPEAVRRAAALLEAYLRQPPRLVASIRMSDSEAIEVLGLQPGADEAAIRAAHRRLMSLVHPDHAGSTWLSRKVTEAKDTLLPGAEETPLYS